MESPHLHWGGKNSTFKLPLPSSWRENAVFVLARSGAEEKGLGKQGGAAQRCFLLVHTQSDTPLSAGHL